MALHRASLDEDEALSYMSDGEAKRLREIRRIESAERLFAKMGVA